MTDTPVPEDREPKSAEQRPTPEPEPAPAAPQAEAEPAPPAEVATEVVGEASAPEPAATEPAAAEPAAPEPAAAAPEASAPEPAAAEGQGESAPPERPAQGQPPGRPQRPRRRRMTAAERHRRTFFAKLTELRKQEQAALAGGPEPTDGVSAEPAPDAAADAPAVTDAAAVAEPADAPAAEPASTPDAEAGAAPAPEPAPAPRAPEPPATSPSRSARAQARLVAAIERVGGAEAVLEALQPKHREDGETMKWSSVCAEQAQGHKPGDPTFTAWVRLAATPVRDVKAIVSPRNRDDDRRGRGRGGRRSGGGGGYERGGGYDRGGGRGARREDIESHGRDGSFRSSVRIVMVDADGSRKEPENAAEAAEAADQLERSNT